MLPCVYSTRVRNAYGATEFPGISVNGEIGVDVDLELVDLPQIGVNVCVVPYSQLLLA